MDYLLAYFILLAIIGLGLLIVYLMIKEQFTKQSQALINKIKFMSWLYS